MTRITETLNAIEQADVKRLTEMLDDISSWPLPPADINTHKNKAEAAKLAAELRAGGEDYRARNFVFQMAKDWQGLAEDWGNPQKEKK